jgi:sarcosine oxidase
MAHGTYDVIVLGIGGMGGAAAYELARRGRRVLGLEQFSLGHDRGSSHGQTRIIRKAYYEHPDYVPLLHRAYQRWFDLEQLSGRHLLTFCGVLNIGRPEGAIVAGVRASARQHGLAVEDLSPDELRRRFPAFRFDDSYVGVLERDGGFLYVDDCVLTYAREAQLAGADIRENEPAVSWETAGNSVTVHTRRHTYVAAKLVITAGPWAGPLLGRAKVPLTVMRQSPFWFGPADDALFRRDVFPGFIAETPEGDYYGLPMIDRKGAKIARHYGQPELPDPAGVDRFVNAADEADVRGFLKRHIPAADGPVRHGSVCLYTLTPDRHFVIDTLPDASNVVVAAGFSGHGFKFASVVGEILADLAETGRTAHPIGLFGLGRFGAK